jgi:hypothetical protein
VVIVQQFLQVNVRGFCSGLVRFEDSEAMEGGRKLSFGGQPTIWFLNSLEAEAKHRAF